MTALHRARVEVHQLAAVVDWLQASLRPGTAKTWRAPTVTAQRRAELDAQARAERLEQTGVAPGESPAPYDLDVAELLSDVLTAVAHLAAATSAAAAVAGPPAPVSASASPTPYLQHVDAHLNALDGELDLLRQVRSVCAGLVRRGWLTLGLVVDGQLLAGVCPWCEGRTDHAPTGGARTLRVRTQPGRRDDEPGRPVVVCEGGRCSPSEAHCGQRWRGMPAWDLFAEGDWLARCLQAAEQVATCPCGQPAFRTGTGRGRPAVYCSELCRRAAELRRRADRGAA